MQDKTMYFQVIMLVLLSSITIAVTSDVFDVSSGDLPWNHTANLTISLIENSTVEIDRIDNTTTLDVVFESSVFLDNASKIVLFNLSLADHQKNDTLIALFNLTNDFNNNSYLYSIIINFTHIPQQYFIVKSQEFLDIIDGNFGKNITSDLLPMSGHFDYQVGGPAGEQLNITCYHAWIECPNQTTFDSDNKTEFRINYTLPQYAQSRNLTVTLETRNITKNKSIIFIIREPDIIFQSYVFTEDCFKTVDNDVLVTMNCIEEYEAWNINRLSTYLQKLRDDMNLTCPNNTVIETEYVMAGSVDKLLLDQFEKCTSTRDDCTETLNSCQKKLTTETSVSKQCHQDKLNQEEKYNDNMNKTLTESTEEVKNTKSIYRKRFWWWMFAALLIAGLIILTAKILHDYNEHRWI